jgi:2-polyprenyl-3-methyl-5-hydroxy-6-metoxy-1,4-benzoquinol methylase
MKEIWNERYAKKEYIYGRTPNEFFKNFIDKQEKATILLPAEGEGRNAVYAARKGWQVCAFDFSEEAEKKALLWADQNKVEINYEVADLTQWHTEEKFDAVALIYIHLSPGIRQEFHKKMVHQLKPGGMIILEAFSKKQIDYDSGGPSDIELLYNTKILNNDFSELKIDFLQERLVELDEGLYHQGEASIIRMIAKK